MSALMLPCLLYICLPCLTSLSSWKHHALDFVHTLSHCFWRRNFGTGFSRMISQEWSIATLVLTPMYIWVSCPGSSSSYLKIWENSMCKNLFVHKQIYDTCSWGIVSEGKRSITRAQVVKINIYITVIYINIYITIIYIYIWVEDVWSTFKVSWDYLEGLCITY